MWLWRISRGIGANQKRHDILNEQKLSLFCLGCKIGSLRTFVATRNCIGFENDVGTLVIPPLACSMRNWYQL